MAIKFVRADITTLKVDAIVNSANPLAKIGGGVDRAIYNAVGAEKLLKERKKIGSIDIGDARVTPGFDLCKVIIHTVGPKWIDGRHHELENLHSCYRNCLALALKEQCRSIAFPLISTGVYGFPKDEALNIATSEINEFLLKHSSVEVIICIFDEDSFVLSGKIAENVEEFINRQKADEKLKEEYGGGYHAVMERSRKSKLIKVDKNNLSVSRYEISSDTSSLADKLLFYVKQTNEKPSAIYNRAWLPRRTYSRIMNGNYVPGKNALIALCLALKLNVEQSYDLLSRNSMTFNPADKTDQFILICIKNKTYDLDKINEGLVKLGLDDKLFIDRKGS